jgi:hypothetical protein
MYIYFFGEKMDAETAGCGHTLQTKSKRRDPLVCSVVPHKLFLILMMWYSCLLLGHNKKTCAANCMSILCKQYSGKTQIINISSWHVSKIECIHLIK